MGDSIYHVTTPFLSLHINFSVSFYMQKFLMSLYPPQTKLRGYIVILMSVRSFVRLSVRPSLPISNPGIWGFPEQKQGLCHYDIWGGGASLIRYSSKTAERNFMKLSGIVHYMMPYTAPPISSFYSNDYGVSQSKTRTLPYKTWGSKGYHFVSIAHSISSFLKSGGRSFNLIHICKKNVLL